MRGTTRAPAVRLAQLERDRLEVRSRREQLALRQLQLGAQLQRRRLARAQRRLGGCTPA
jgi:hypothetical protein